MPFLITPLILSFSTAAISQLFAAVRDDLNQDPQGCSESVIATIRMAFTAGWIVGPVVGTWLSDTAGLHVTLWLTALCFLAQIIPVGNLKFRKVRPSETPFPETSALPSSRLRAMRPLLLFTGFFVLVNAGDFLKFGFLPVYMYQNLHLDSAVRGAVIGTQPFVEFAVMPFTVMLARRVGLLWLMSGGAALAVGASICYATIGSALGMFAGQILVGGAWAIFASLGIIIAQRLLPTAVATASGIFVSSSAFEQRSWRSYWRFWRRHSRPAESLLHPGGICCPRRDWFRGYGQIRLAEIGHALEAAFPHVAFPPLNFYGAKMLGDWASG
jgi:SET family sugar efflux transporter-like MFS transporter